MSLVENVEVVRGRIADAARRAGRSPDAVTLIAVSKTFPAAAVLAAAEAGLRDFGENRPQEAAEKIPAVNALMRPTWHLVGHLQTNKVRLALDLFDVIHSVDSVHLAKAIGQRARRPVDVLLEVNVAREPTKNGFLPEEGDNAIVAACERIRRLPNLRVRGLMTVAPQVERPELARPVFQALRLLRDQLGLEWLSMGMTEDFEIAVEEGATHVRIGRAIFGTRQ
ncbi:MAG: YggS family pyridoxal phosphate-dependent enzyme [Chloroflexi bacterium]|nr:YggS family pyridoxal phosphate-dependent enzyme [Chloroflexota bacterium]